MSGSIGTSYQSLEQLVQSFESGTPGQPGTGNYSAQNPTSSASGAYGFVNSTWLQFLSQIGGDTAQYPTAASAPASVQDSVFSQAVSQSGLSSWLCPNCDPALSNYINNNPSLASLPVSGAAGSSTPATASGSATPASNNGASGQNSCGTAFNPLNWPCYVFSASIVQRVGYGIMGFVLIALALLIYALRTRDQG